MKKIKINTYVKKAVYEDLIDPSEAKVILEIAQQIDSIDTAYQIISVLETHAPVGTKSTSELINAQVTFCLSSIIARIKRFQVLNMRSISLNESELDES